MVPGGRACANFVSRCQIYLLTILTPNSEPDLSLLANGAFGPLGALEAFGAPGPAGGACGGGLEGPVSELREPLALPVPVAPTLGGGDCAFRSSSLGASDGAAEDVVPSDVCTLRVAGGKPCGGGCTEGGAGVGAFFDLDLNKNDMASDVDEDDFMTDSQASDKSRRLRG